MSEPLPLPEEHFNEDGRRLWVGNLDENITEFSLLKLLQKYGDLEQFDFLYHKVGPDKGKPRGYCFATYATPQQAERAQKHLHGKIAMKKKLIVKPAQGEKDLTSVCRAEANVPLCLSQGQSRKSSQNSCVSSQIAALEAQLKSLEQKQKTDINAFLLPDQKKQESSPRNQNTAGHVGGSRNSTESKHQKTKEHVSKNHNQRPSSHHYNQNKPYSKHKQ